MFKIKFRSKPGQPNFFQPTESSLYRPDYTWQLNVSMILVLLFRLQPIQAWINQYDFNYFFMSLNSANIVQTS